MPNGSPHSSQCVVSNLVGTGYPHATQLFTLVGLGTRNIADMRLPSALRLAVALFFLLWYDVTLWAHSASPGKPLGLLDALLRVPVAAVPAAAGAGVLLRLCHSTLAILLSTTSTHISCTSGGNA